MIFPVRTDGGSTEKRRIVEIADLEVESNQFVWEETGSGPTLLSLYTRSTPSASPPRADPAPGSTHRARLAAGPFLGGHLCESPRTNFGRFACRIIDSGAI
jgi:hypothetical protein